MGELNDNLPRYLQVIAENTGRAIAHSIPIAVGTDGGPAGASTHLEMELLVKYGWTPAQVLVAASWGGALALGIEDDAGTLEAGRNADVVILDANPLQDIRNSRRVAWVIKGGIVYNPESLLN